MPTIEFMDEKASFSRWIKVWVGVALCSLFAYVLYWLPASFELIYRSFLHGITMQRLLSFYFISDVLVSTVGLVLRFVGVSIALVSIYLVWGPKALPFRSIRKKVAVAVLFEGIYFLSYLPITIYYLGLGFVPMLFVGYLFQIIAVFPLLAVLSLKIWRYNNSAKTNLSTWISVAAIGYLANIWISNVFRWLSMVEIAGLTFLFQGISAFGFLNSIVTLSLSLIFAIAGCYYLPNKDDRKLSTKLFGTALILLGLHFIIYILYSVVVGASVYSVLVIEVWPVTVLGLGLSMLLGINKT